MVIRLLESRLRQLYSREAVSSLPVYPPPPFSSFSAVVTYPESLTNTWNCLG